MKNSTYLFFATSLLAITAISANAAIVGIGTGKWFFIRGTGVIKASDFSNFVLGDGTTESANDQAIAAPFTSGTLKQAGDSITLSGTVCFIGAQSSANQFRLGLMDNHDQEGNTGWLGYFFSNSNGGTAGMLYERNKPNTADPLTIQKEGAALEMPAATNNANFKAGNSYRFTLSYTRLADNQLKISYSLTSGKDYDLSGSFTDSTPQTFTFNRICFLSGGDMRADQLKFSNVEIAFKRAR